MNLRATLLLLASLLGACGGNLSQPAARDRATSESCNWYEKCGEIGSGKQFASRDACEVDVRAHWNQHWPVDECDEKIPPERFDACITAIRNTSCDNGLDFFNTVFNKCGKAEVCVAATK